MRQFFIILCFLFLSMASEAQKGESVEVNAYWDIAVSANIWPGPNKSIGIQTAGGFILNKSFTVGFGVGIGTTNYEYFHVPLELGYVSLQGNAIARIYGGPTFATRREEVGFLGGTEFVFRPRFDMRNLKLFFALGVAFDYSVANRFSNPVDPSQRNLLAGPRIRMGLAL